MGGRGARQSPRKEIARRAYGLRAAGEPPLKPRRTRSRLVREEQSDACGAGRPSMAAAGSLRARDRSRLRCSRSPRRRPPQRLRAAERHARFMSTRARAGAAPSPTRRRRIVPWLPVTKKAPCRAVSRDSGSVSRVSSITLPSTRSPVTAISRRRDRLRHLRSARRSRA